LKNTKIYITVVTVVLALTGLTVAAYVWKFGTTLSGERGDWSGFGDYFGGVLNPIFALLAFMGLLWSIHKQGEDFRVSLELLRRQTNSAEEQVNAMRQERAGEEMLHVVKEVDAHIERILNVEVGGTGSALVNIRQMKSEAERVKANPKAPYVGAYLQFVQQATTSGSIVESHARELVYLVGQARKFLEAYAAINPSYYPPTLKFYADRCESLMDMVEDIGGLPPDTRAVFARIANS
jgi:hypothetical protein